MSISRKRLNSEESRSAALEAARLLLLEQGPQAVTLKAVAAKVGRTHANLLHHFGSAAGLQAELAKFIADRVTGSIAESVGRARAHDLRTAARGSPVQPSQSGSDRSLIRAPVAGSVNDSAAETFAQTFYRGLLQEKPIGQALAEARAALDAAKMQDWADYIFYGSVDFSVKKSSRA